MTNDLKTDGGLHGDPPMDAISLESSWQKTQRLLHASILAVDELAEHLKAVPDEPRMYKANKVLHELYRVE